MVLNGSISLTNKHDFTYDAGGNITARAIYAGLSTVMTYTYDNRLATFSGQNVTYDADGNMTYGPLNGVMTNFNWDARNRLTGVGNMTYLYDALNNRVSVTENVYGSQHETRYVIDPNADLSQTLIKTDPNGKQIFYVYGLGLIGEETEGVYRTYHYDRRGITDRFNYGPYGELLSHTGITSTPFMYNGRDGVMTDANGLYFMRARYYSPEIKRFLSEDTFKGKYDDLLRINLFAYVNGNPISYIDPNGKWKSKAEQEWAYKSWVSKDYNEMWHLGERWQKEPKNRKAIQARANKIRSKYQGTGKTTTSATTPKKQTATPLVAGFAKGGGKPWHTDYSLDKSKYLHWKDGDYDLRFNNNGKLVEHSGKVIGDPKGREVKILEKLIEANPKFFNPRSFMPIISIPIDMKQIDPYYDWQG